MTTALTAASGPHIEVRAHGDFVEWLAAAGGALAVTTYNSGKLALYAARQGSLHATFVKLPRPMGLSHRDGRLAVATRDRIVIGAVGLPSSDALLPAGDGRAATFTFRAALVTGRLDVHELVYDNLGLCFANTRHNCLARPRPRASYRPVWRPPFLQHSVRADACHLNGLGVKAGRVAMVTAFAECAEPGRWRSDDKFSSGVVMDVRGRRVAVRGLCMPHSPRWDGRRWWLCNSGEGALCTFDPRRGVFESIAYLPGFTRGLCFAAGRAVTGLSRIRRRHILDAPPVRRRFPKMHSGLWLVDPDNGGTTGFLEFVRGGREVFDVVHIDEGNIENRRDL